MDFNELYGTVVELYRENKSVNITASMLNVSTVKVRRILITEGLWSSETSIKIGKLYKEGLTTEEIADKLYMSLKNVQAYIPYSRGAYGENSSNDSVRSKLYRNRKQTLKGAAMVPHSDAKNIKGLSLPNLPAIKGTESAQLEIGKTIPFAPKKDEILELKFEIVQYSVDYKVDYVPISGLDIDLSEDLLYFARAKEGITRTVLVPGDLTLHSLHYLICKAFGLLNIYPHNFRLTDSEFRRHAKEYGKWREYQGALFNLPKELAFLDRSYDDDYDGNYSFGKWLRSKYIAATPSYTASETYPYQKNELFEFETDIKKRYKTTLNVLKGRSLKRVSRHLCTPDVLKDLLERLTLSEILTDKEEPIPEEEFKSGIQNSIHHAKENYDTLSALEKRQLHAYLKKYEAYYKSLMNLKEKGKGESELILEYRARIEQLKSILWPAMESFNPRLEPFTNKIIYTYESEDTWTVLITCTKKEAGKIDAPKCTKADGLNVIEDIGGLTGYLKLLKTINGVYGEAEKSRALYAARTKGFTGRKNKPENIL